MNVGLTTSCVPPPWSSSRSGAGLPRHTPARRAAGRPPPAQQDRADGLDRL